jgi:MtN3 and saliva related transmembrane protein
MDDWMFVGLLAGFLTTVGFVPQIIKGWRTKRMADVSLFMPILLSFGMGLWLVYGLILRDLPIVLWNAISLGLNLSIIVLKVVYGRREVPCN